MGIVFIKKDMKNLGRVYVVNSMEINRKNQTNIIREYNKEKVIIIMILKYLNFRGIDYKYIINISMSQ